jgi:hypothetical protein
MRRHSYGGEAVAMFSEAALRKSEQRPCEACPGEEKQSEGTAQHDNARALQRIESRRLTRA